MSARINSARISLFVASIIALGVFTVSTIGDLFVLRTPGDHVILALLDHAALAIFAGAIILLYDWRRRRDLHEKLTTIHEINHHVRNQLEVIEYSAWATHDREHVARIHDSVKHIDWALREILGRDEPPSPRPLQDRGTDQATSD